MSTWSLSKKLFVNAFNEVIYLAHLPKLRSEKIIHLTRLFIYRGFSIV